MKQTFDLDEIMFKLLNVKTITDEISGGIYLGDGRPEDSSKEDVVVNSIDLTQDYLPQVATTNVNIYVPDKPFQIDGKCQFVACRDKLKAIAGKVVAVLRNAVVPGLKFVIEAQNFLREESIKQHYVNIRISWNIQID